MLTAVDNSAKFYKAAIGRDVAYTLILTVHGAVPKYLRLFLLSDVNEATDLFNLYSTRVIPIAVASKHISSSTSKMQVCIGLTSPLKLGLELTRYIPVSQQ